LTVKRDACLSGRQACRKVFLLPVFTAAKACYNLEKDVGGVVDNKMERAEGSISTRGGYAQGSIRQEGVSRVGILCDHDMELMTEFSRVCVRRLGKHLPFKLFLSFFQPVLDANVHKEITKDKLVITHAAAGFDRGMDRAEMDVDGLFEMTREIDNEFVRKLSSPLFSIDIRYEDFAEIRKRRIVSLVSMVFDLMGNWRDIMSLADNLKNAYTAKRYREFLGELLHLYNIETRILSNSFTLYGPAVKMKDLFAEKLFATMEKTAEDLCAEYTRRVYGDGDRPSAGPA
jgi:hypothetical protein